MLRLEKVKDEPSKAIRVQLFEWNSGEFNLYPVGEGDPLNNFEEKNENMTCRTILFKEDIGEAGETGLHFFWRLHWRICFLLFSRLYSLLACPSGQHLPPPSKPKVQH